MFEAICLRSTTDGGTEPLDLGLLAEAMLFYGKVDLVLNRAFLTQLIHSLGPEGLLELAEFEGVALSYCNQFDAVLTESVTSEERYFLGLAEMPHTRLDQIATELFRESVGKSGRGRRLADRFLSRVEDVRLDDRLHETATADALNADYMTQAVTSALAASASEYVLPSPLLFRCERTEAGDLVDRLVVRSNIDWAAANENRRPSASEITPASLLGPIMTTLIEMAFAGRLKAELATNPVVASLVRTKSEALFASSESADIKRQQFQELVFSDARVIREAVNSGERSLYDALELSRDARRFRSWLADQPADADLLHEYYRECVAGSWAERLSTKAVRWLVVTGGGTAAGALIAPPLGAAVGPVLGTVDALQDAFRTGWKPHQFVEKRLRGFVEVD